MSEGGRNWGLRLLALGIALGIWFNASVEDRLVSSEKLVEASVIYNRPRGFVVLDQVQNVNVRMIGSKKAIRQLSPFMVDVQVDLSQRQEGNTTINLARENVLAPDGLEVVSIEPNTIRVRLERELTQRVPVVPKIIGEPGGRAKLDGEPEVFPNQVLVSGPESLVSRLASLATRPIDLDGRSITFEETVAVMPPDPLIQIVQPSQVTVRVLLSTPESDEADGANNPRKDEP